jgi:hypothetical protein
MTKKTKKKTNNQDLSPQPDHALFPQDMAPGNVPRPVTKEDIMKSWIGAVALVGMLASGGAMAGDGNRLLLACKDGIKVMEGDTTYNPFEAGYCAGIVEAVETTLAVVNGSLPKEYRTCFPATGTTIGQKARIVIKYLEENPAELSEQAAVLAIKAYKTAYWCK